jgi:hypothetical protein
MVYNKGEKMITFSKSTEHYGEKDTESVYIHTEAQTLGDLTKAFNKFLTACGYQVVDDAQEELDLRRKDKDFFI